jgi:hypothetical protein
MFRVDGFIDVDFWKLHTAPLDFSYTQPHISYFLLIFVVLDNNFFECDFEMYFTDWDCIETGSVEPIIIMMSWIVVISIQVSWNYISLFSKFINNVGGDVGDLVEKLIC